ncbi:GSU2403 family nucleotidyltransferase fold protein [Bradyrhizobium pachyrhizi]|uniref:GSU2403 family nucleotidyltransferase fold protein n=1 Tax=Bradyrhizobium pachyrhizi TaxID=280333 RepID=UPI001AECA344
MRNNKANISSLLAARGSDLSAFPASTLDRRCHRGACQDRRFCLRGMLIGAIAHQTYAAMLGVRRSVGSRQTGDVDIAQFKMSRWLSTTQRRPFWTC